MRWGSTRWFAVPTAAILLTAAILVALPQSAGAAGADPAKFKGHDYHPLSRLTANANCQLLVPKDPLSAKGLATPYQLIGCSESDANFSAFVQATILDPRTGHVSVYNPLVVTQGTQPAVAPVAPQLPRGAVVGIWTGFNGRVLKLVGPGANGSVNFAQQAYINSPQFFAALNRSIMRGQTEVPRLGNSTVDGKPCPSARDWSIVDQDQSDNTTTTYLFDANGRSAQDTAANRAKLPTAIANASDEKLLGFVGNVLGCTPWQAPLLEDPGHTMASGILQEAQAAKYQAAPQALVPGLDPFVLDGNGNRNLGLQNLYRQQVGQPTTNNSNDTLAYCNNLASLGEPRLKLDAQFEQGPPPPALADVGTNLANALAGRYAATWVNLTCDKLTGKPSPITITTDANGKVTSATYV